MGGDTTWVDGEVFALAGFDHDKADVLRRILNFVESGDEWLCVKQMVLQNASADDLGDVLRKRFKEAAAYCDESEDWRLSEIARLEEIEPTLALFAADAVNQMVSRDIWLDVMRIIAEAHAKANSPETRAGKNVTLARYLVDKKDFRYLPPNLRKEMPKHIQQLTEWSDQFARLRALADLDKLRSLSDRFPHCDHVIEGIAEGIERAWDMGSNIIHIQPTLLVGEAGVGKTALAREVCKTLGLHVQIANVGGKSENHLFGLSAGWSSAHAGIVTEAVATARVLNPVIILDEIDKTHAGRNGDITGELLGMLEPMEARRYREKYLAADVNAAHVSWILTANDLGCIPAPLRSRCTIYDIPVPTPEQLPAVIRSMVGEYAAELGLRREFFSLDLGDVEALVETFKQHKSVRVLHRFVRGLLHQKLKRRRWN
ncbi:AAA family ATPase [Rhodobacteraceae bacterium B1Z28]|uniref:AAA family ATPase n=1 Tax=Ruegeria haliotis TaxID=2747601 RepID=A0ABX2PU37_9RHOB|nr:AAA family ATPase [Ruegeria haliotis]NVO56886.1 AAA family ATPase [Ruegeria haliotis]